MKKRAIEKPFATTVRVEPEIKAAIDKAMKGEQRSASKIVSLALQDWLRKHRYLAAVALTLGFGLFHPGPARAWTDYEDAGLSAADTLPVGARISRSRCYVAVAGATSGANACTVLSQKGSPNTVVIMGQGKMLIQRHQEAGTATLWDIKPDGSTVFLSSVIARGNCWEGHTMRFCAE